MCRLQVDDFYTTGLLLEPLNVTYISLASLYVLKAAEMHEKLVDSFSIFGHLPSSINRRYAMWREIEMVCFAILNNLNY